MRFNDEIYLKQYYELKQFPKIHDDIFYLCQKLKGKHTAIDLGCCFGLLAKRLLFVFDKVIGIESNTNYLEKAINCSKIKYYNIEVNMKTLSQLEQIIKKYKVDILVARRVIPELYETGGEELLYFFKKTIYNSGINYIVLEGRKSNANAVNPLSTIEKEVKVFLDLYEIQEQYRNCILLRRK